MPNLQIPHLDIISQRDPLLGEALRAFQTSLNTVASQTGATAQGIQSTPNAPSQLNVTAAGGIFDVAIQDNLPSQVGVAPDYFLEYSLTPNFIAPIVIHLGPARNHRANLGNQTLYWRTYSQNGRASQPSGKTYFGPFSAPTPVVGGGSITGPNPLASAGSGTAPTNGTRGGSGYGVLPVREQ
jgi:hypothetical protein